MNQCPYCEKEMKYKVYDWLEGFGASEWEKTCSCGYYVHYAYGSYTEIIGGVEHRYYYTDLARMQSGEVSIKDFEVPSV